MKAILFSLLIFSNLAYANFDGSWKFIDATSDIYIDIEDNEQNFTIERIYIWHPFISYEKNDDIILTKEGSNLLYKGMVVGEYENTYFDITISDEESGFYLMLYASKREMNQLYIYSTFDIFEIDGTFALAP